MQGFGNFHGDSHGQDNETGAREIWGNFSRRRQFFGTILSYFNKMYLNILHEHLACTNKLFLTSQERDSVMLGEISPHHDYCDSKSSSETPPSYNQLNYNENLQRFFDSRPRTLTASDENSDLKVHSLLEEEEKTSPGAANNG